VVFQGTKLREKLSPKRARAGGGKIAIRAASTQPGKNLREASVVKASRKLGGGKKNPSSSLGPLRPEKIQATEITDAKSHGRNCHEKAAVRSESKTWGPHVKEAWGKCLRSCKKLVTTLIGVRKKRFGGKLLSSAFGSRKGSKSDSRNMQNGDKVAFQEREDAAYNSPATPEIISEMLTSGGERKGGASSM